MTEKQKQCIEWICKTLGVKYYGKNNKHDALVFIHKFIDRAKERAQETAFYDAWGLSFFFNAPIGK